MRLEEHPIVQKVRAAHQVTEAAPQVLEAAWLRQVCLDAGADDVGFVSIDADALGAEREHILATFPAARALVSFVVRLNRESTRSPVRSIANLEFRHGTDEIDKVARRIVCVLEARGIAALNPAMAFPMEVSRFPERMWPIAHKIVAEAAGMGRMGIHRSVIHPRFGSFVLLGTVVVGVEISQYASALDFNPCVECKLCVAACPVGAIGADGYFNFSACYTHNYREFLTGFNDWVETVTESRGAADYRRRVSDRETLSMWQSLVAGPSYKSAYCLSVCPAGEEVISPFLADRASYFDRVVEPLTTKVETLYVLEGSDAEQHAARRFPHKLQKRVHNGIRPHTIRDLLSNLGPMFQPGRAKKVDATYHFLFTGEEEVKATITIRQGTLSVREGLEGAADLRVTADTRTWLDFLGRERSIVWALLRGRIRLWGSPRLLLEFGRCFPL